jgi:nitrite reductase/ring-hydroxylating ferredoxin subunit
MMALLRVGSLAKLPAGTVMEATIGDERYAICNLEGAIHALSGTCPHRGGPLGQGAVNENNLTCPWHAWEFDCRTGVSDYNPGMKIATFPVQVSGDDILIEIP